MIRLPHIPRSALGPILMGALLILLIFWRHAAPHSRMAPPWAIHGTTIPGQSLRASLPTPAPLIGSFIQRANLDITSVEGLYDMDEQLRFAADAEAALDYVSRRFGVDPTGKIRVYIGQSDGCGLHGIAYTDQRLIQVFTCADLPRTRPINILAHEFIHQLAHDHYGPAHLQADMIVLEGVATWGAGAYWLGEHPSFAAFARAYRQSVPLLPLATDYNGRSIDEMNMLYYQWASFVDFLITVYGRDAFDALYVSGAYSSGSADYSRVYGKSLDVLEHEWLTWLEQAN